MARRIFLSGAVLRTLARSFATLVCLVVPLAASAQSPVGSIYPQQAPIRSEHVGLVRLPLSAEVLAACSPDLSDLRVFHGDHETSYYVDAVGRAQQAVPTQHFLEIVEAERLERPVEGGPSRMVERYTVALPAEMGQSTPWALTIEGAAPRYVRRVVVHAADEDGTLRRELARGTIFRLPRPRAERRELVLPSTDASRIVVEIEGDGFYLEPTFRLVAHPEPLDPADIELPLEELSRSTLDGVTTIRLRRPRGFVPDRLVVRTQARTFHLRIVARDASGDGESIVGDGDIFRIADLPEAETLELPLGSTNGEVLELDVSPQDGPMPEFQLVGVVRQPALIFDHDYGSVLRFGGGRARLPDYGIAAVLSGRVLAGREIPGAELGTVERNPEFDPSPALAFAMHPGREVDRRAYAHQQSVRVPASQEGLVRVVPLPETLAAAHPGLGDLRIVDGENRQWAFVEGAEQIVDVEQRLSGIPYNPGEEDIFELPLPATRYEVPLPASPLYVHHLTIASPAAYVDRNVTLIAKVEDVDDPFIVATGRLLVRPDERRRALELAISSARIESMYLVIADGDDAPLRELTVELGYPTTPLFLPAPEGDYELLVGAIDLDPPIYELASARDLIFSVSSVDATLGALESNPAYEPPSAYSRELWKDILLWVVLILGVVVLLVLTLRSAESSPLKPSEAGSETGSGSGSGSGSEPGSASESEPGPASEPGPTREEE